MSALPPAGEPDVMPPADPVAVDLVGVADEDPRAARALGRRRRFGRLRRGGRGFWTQPAVVVAVCILGIWVLVAAAAPWLAPYDPIAQSADLYAAPSSAHWFGTDELGRDVFSRVLYGARLSIPLAAIIVAAALAIGGVLGLVAGYLGRFADEGLMRLTDLVFAFPQIILAMAISAAFGPSARNAVVALVIVSWPVYARVIRSAALAIRGSDYLASARLLGVGPLRALRRDVVPNAVGPAVVLATLELGNAVLLLAALSFLGLGPRPPAAEWGAMIAAGSRDLSSWWMSGFPGLAILTVVLAFNVLGDALRDRLDPRFARSPR
ncbi:binding-protein-dependent transport systems inner membrane component [Beutenbergia cavernae DSM 12333]|uniref:Binding-protein-dependent transport systems inner membrane component n=1 Tax=Beutenbergia cavernae (strain ATCC BAA-8 / DSM 12333 / CCUG 43141 / JCM 11478 / NBRC 16432 / NCIMB 13614 / HKI 0122) TaxID=471853 RepID=C5BVI7_BEUC1|nr:ABC transporter permease [Beutenbergia cavernae]ACQ78427.1 binding-protein-dependent transport systems inner membrane component [Beutenbergia cavernae DSM 12333]